MKNIAFLFLTLCLVTLSSCAERQKTVALREPVDTIGFPHLAWQTDSIVKRINRYSARDLTTADAIFPDNVALRVALSPHDDYSYVGYLYPALFKNVRSKVVIMFGVAHKASKFRLEDRIVFGSAAAWRSPAGKVMISPLQEEIMKALPADMFVINDSMQNAEHSLEGLVPMLEYFSPGTRIIPVLVPYCSLGRMKEIAEPLADAIDKTMKKADLSWGEGYSILISSDAVHYGNEEWGGKNYDRFGVDTAGYRQAVAYENQIAGECFTGPATAEKVEKFYNYTVSSSDYHDYVWTWCGRYSIPLGMLTSIRLAEKSGMPLDGKIIGYSTSIARDTIPVHDLGMGQTAPARLAHWVGYAAAGFE